MSMELNEDEILLLERTLSLPMPFFLFIPFSSYPSVLHSPAPSHGFSQGSAVKQRSYTRFPGCAVSLGMSQSSGAWGYAATQNSLVLQGHLPGLLFPKSWECTPSAAPSSAPMDHVL